MHFVQLDAFYINFGQNSKHALRRALLSKQWQEVKKSPSVQMLELKDDRWKAKIILIVPETKSENLQQVPKPPQPEAVSFADFAGWAAFP